MIDGGEMIEWDDIYNADDDDDDDDEEWRYELKLLGYLKYYNNNNNVIIMNIPIWINSWDYKEERIKYIVMNMKVGSNC